MGDVGWRKKKRPAVKTNWGGTEEKGDWALGVIKEIGRLEDYRRRKSNPSEGAAPPKIIKI